MHDAATGIFSPGQMDVPAGPNRAALKMEWKLHVKSAAKKKTAEERIADNQEEQRRSKTPFYAFQQHYLKIQTGLNDDDMRSNVSRAMSVFQGNVHNKNVPLELSIMIQLVLFFNRRQQYLFINALMSTGPAHAINHWNTMVAGANGQTFWDVHGAIIMQLGVPLFADKLGNWTTNEMSQECQAANQRILRLSDETATGAGVSAKKRHGPVEEFRVSPTHVLGGNPGGNGNYLQVLDNQGQLTGYVADATPIATSVGQFREQAVGAVNQVRGDVSQVRGDVAQLQQFAREQTANRPANWVSSEQYAAMTPEQKQQLYDARPKRRQTRGNFRPRGGDAAPQQ